MVGHDETYKDSFRKPDELLAFAGLQSDARVLDVGTGYGYLAKHMASKLDKYPVMAQNGSEWRGFFESVGIGPAIREMQQTYGIRHYFASMQDPADSLIDTYDLVTMQTCFHDLFDMPIDRTKFFASIRNSLKPQGHFLLVDHCAAPGRGTKDAGANRGLHRIEESLVRQELEANGFRVVRSSDMFRTATDKYGTSAWTNPMRNTDRFVLLCQKG